MVGRRLALRKDLCVRIYGPGDGVSTREDDVASGTYRAERNITGLISKLGGRMVCRNVILGGVVALLDGSFSSDASDDLGSETE